MAGNIVDAGEARAVFAILHALFAATCAEFEADFGHIVAQTRLDGGGVCAGGGVPIPAADPCCVWQRQDCCDWVIMCIGRGRAESSADCDDTHKGNAMPAPVYSPLFTTLHDEPTPVGKLGRGAHYSILSAVQWNNAKGGDMVKPLLHRFAVIWDEDHDTRVIPVLEAAYMNNLLAPVLFIGERKATLTAIVDDAFEITDFYTEAWARIADVAHKDSWGFEIARLSDMDNVQIINASPSVVATYLANIQNIWQLGMHAHASQEFDSGDVPGLKNVFRAPFSF